MRCTFIIAMVSLSVMACGQPAGEPASSSQPSPAPSDAPAAPAGPTLIEGIGPLHHPIQTSSKEAQAWFDQGMSLVFAFNHEEAARSFERAAQLDPAAAMPYWGIAWAVGPNYNLDVDDPRAKQAFDAITKAQAIVANGPETEQAYIRAQALRYSNDPKADRAALARRYSQAMRELMRNYPDDLDAATLYAESLMNLRPWKLWTLDGKPAEDTLEIMSVLESVLARNPDHVGANHYYIHTVEASPNPGRALPSARRLENLVPAAGHLVHMPAHIYARTGDHASAAKANSAGAEADRVYLKTAPPGGFYGMAYYSHNLHFLADSNMMQGRFADAKQAADDMTAALSPHVQMMPMGESMLTMKTSVLLRFGRYDDVLALPTPPSDQPVSTAWWHFARGVAFARTGKSDEAARERQALNDATAKVPDSALFGGTGLEPARGILSLAGGVLDAHLAAARGNRQESIALWRKVVAGGDRVAYDEPPVWFYPLRESLGAELLRAGNAAEAERVFREDLVKHPRNARALFGLRESLARQKKDSTWVELAFDAAWKQADVKLSVEGL